MIMSIKNQFFFLLLLISCYEARSQDNGAAKKEKVSLCDNGLRYGHLSNGFTYYIRRHDNPKKTVEFHLVVKGGFFHENEEQLEYSHLIEHMGAVRTKNFPNLDKHLWEMGGYNHAGTENSHTYYWARLPSGAEEVKTGLQVIRDWAQNMDFPQEVVDVERGAVLGEMRNTDVYRSWLNYTIEEKVLNSTGEIFENLQKHKKNIEVFNRKAFLEFYNDWYRPDLEAAIIVGDINVDSMEKEVKLLFSDLKTPKTSKNSQDLVDAQKVTLNGENTFQLIRDTINPSFRMEIISKHLNSNSFGLKKRADFKRWLMQQLYKEMIESRSADLIQQSQPPFSKFKLSFGSAGFGKNKVINGTRMTVDFGIGNQQQIKKKFIQAVVAWEQLHSNFKLSELQKAKEKLQKRLLGKAVTSHDLADEYRHHFVKGEAVLAPELKEGLIITLLDEINLQEMQRDVLEYGNLEKNTDFLVFNAKDPEVRTFDVFQSWIREVKSIEVKDFEPLATINSLADVIEFPLEEIPPIENISENLLGVTTVTLHNGLRILFKPSDPGSQRYKGLVTIDAFRQNRVPFSIKKEFLAFRMVPDYMDYSGAGPLTRFDLDRFIQEKEIRLKFFADAQYQRFYGRSKRADIDELLNLLFLYANQPKRSTEAFAALKADYNNSLKGLVTPGSFKFVLDDKIESKWFPKMPVLQISDLENLKLNDVYAAYKKYFTDFTGYTFVITGDFDTEQILAKLVRKISAFPVSHEKVVENGEINFPLKRMDEIIRLKNIDQAFVRLYFPVIASHDIKTQIELQLLSKALYARIWSRLRQGSFAPTAGGDWIDTKKGIFSFIMNFDSELGNENLMIQNATDELQKLREFGVDQAWLEAAITDELTAFEKHLERYGAFNFWREYLFTKLEGCEDLEQEVLQYSTVMKHFITVEDINKAAKKYLSEENMQQFVFLPE